MLIDLDPTIPNEHNHATTVSVYDTDSPFLALQGDGYRCLEAIGDDIALEVDQLFDMEGLV
ncbi:MAG: hypothetical protein CBB68_13130 [Rhodospirillaceae bacterium TMED8]|nr:hypothetical protein [Magnetovibrio sp.]OUT49046.1 MAG: hypothetical protein CBB68_13130 [Rhodospirillaceae bacterium TMED8]|tara:strand:- start:8507 stop:8689 length:183 start_codon:yes stop_codon:yes gene_type:complete